MIGLIVAMLVMFVLGFFAGVALTVYAYNLTPPIEGMAMPEGWRGGPHEL